MKIKLKYIGIGLNDGEKKPYEYSLEERTTIKDLIEQLNKEKYISYNPLVIVNKKHRSLDYRLSDDDEVTLIIPAGAG